MGTNDISDTELDAVVGGQAAVQAAKSTDATKDKKVVDPIEHREGNNPTTHKITAG